MKNLLKDLDLQRIERIIVSSLHSCPILADSEIELGVFTCYTKQTNGRFLVSYCIKDQEEKEFCSQVGFFTTCELCPWNDSEGCRWHYEVIDSKELLGRLEDPLTRGRSVILIFEDGSIEWIYPKLPCEWCNLSQDCFVFNLKKT